MSNDLEGTPLISKFLNAYKKTIIMLKEDARKVVWKIDSFEW
jgi:hypothetical protein